MNIRIRTTESSDIADILELATNCFGTGYLDGYLDADRLDRPGTLSLVARLNDNSNEFCGFILGSLGSNEAELKTIAVKPEFEGRGIATQLVKSFIGVCISSRISSVSSPAWKNGSRVPVDPLLHKLGFTPEQEYPDYWHTDSLQRKYQCTICGNPCHCTAVIYRRQLSGLPPE